MKHSPLTRLDYFASIHHRRYHRWWIGTRTPAVKWGVVWDRTNHIMGLKRRMLLDARLPDMWDRWRSGPLSYQREARGDASAFLDQTWSLDYRWLSLRWWLTERGKL